MPVSSFAIGLDGSGDTTGMPPSAAMEALKEALVEAVKLPVVNATDHGYDYELCFQLPNGIAEETVQVPPLVYHFDGGATMLLRRDSFLVEVSAGKDVPSDQIGCPRGYHRQLSATEYARTLRRAEPQVLLRAHTVQSDLRCEMSLHFGVE